MPSLKQLKCTIEKGADNTPLNEFGTKYHDGAVETFVRVPPKPTSFSVHLKSTGYIAPGLAMFVFMDGVSQCNRNRRGLVIPETVAASADAEIDFRVRQKEDKLENSKFIGREWSFQQLNIAAANQTTKVDRDVLAGVGTIEVVVLRCHGEVSPLTNAKKATGKGGTANVVVDVGGFDGAMDLDTNPHTRSFHFGLDGNYDTDEDRPPAARLPAEIRREQGWPPIPQRPETPENLKRYASQRNALAGLEETLQRQGIGAAAPQLDGGRSPAGGVGYPPNYPWPPSAAIGAYPYPAPWNYPPYNMPLQPISFMPGPGSATKTKWEPLWAKKQTIQPGSPHKEKVQPLWAKKRTSDVGRKESGAIANNHANSVISPAKNDDWNTGKNEQQSPGWNDWNDKHDHNDTGNKDGDAWDNNVGKNDNIGDGGNNWGNDVAQKDDWKKDQNNSGNDWDNQNKTSGGDESWKNPGSQQNDQIWGDAHKLDDNWGNETTKNQNGTNNNDWTRNNAKDTSRRIRDKASNSSLQRAASDGAFDPNQSHIKPYWTKWNQRVSPENDDGGKDPYIVPEEPLPAIPESLAQKENMSHQIRAGKGRLYYHTTGTPKYIDSMESPYAVFTFKYRSKEALQKIFPGLKIKTDTIPLQERWKTMTEDERLAYVLELQADISDGEATNDDGEDPDGESTHSRSTTRRKKSNKSKRSKAAGGGWDSTPVKDDKPNKKVDKSKNDNDWNYMDDKGKKKSEGGGGNEWHAPKDVNTAWDDDQGKKKSEGDGGNDWGGAANDTKPTWDQDAGGAAKAKDVGGQTW